MLLLAANADIHYTDRISFKTLYYAINRRPKTNDIDSRHMLKLLIKAGSDPNVWSWYSPLI